MRWWNSWYAVCNTLRKAQSDGRISTIGPGTMRWRNSWDSFCVTFRIPQAGLDSSAFWVAKPCGCPGEMTMECQHVPNDHRRSFAWQNFWFNLYWCVILQLTTTTLEHEEIEKTILETNYKPRKQNKRKYIDFLIGPSYALLRIFVQFWEAPLAPPGVADDPIQVNLLTDQGFRKTSTDDAFVIFLGGQWVDLPIFFACRFIQNSILRYRRPSRCNS